MTVRPTYLAVAALVFGLLALIETQLNAGFIRFSVGDALVVVLVYAVIMAITQRSRTTGAALALGIAYLVELSQALDLVERLGVTPNRLTDVVFGNTFTWSDIVAYTVGIAITLLIEAVLGSRRADAG